MLGLIAWSEPQFVCAFRSFRSFVFKRIRVRFVEVGRQQRSHHPNELNSDVNRTRVRTKSASVNALDVSSV